MWKKTGNFENRPESTLIFEVWNPDDNSSEAFSVFWLKASTISSFELISEDPLRYLRKCFLWVIYWNSASELLELQTPLFLVFTRIRWTFIVSMILFSFINKKPLIRLKTAVFFVATVFNTFSTHLIFKNEKSWECRSGISRKTLFGTFIAHNCRKILLHVKDYFWVFFFCLKSWLITFSGPLSTFLLLCC